MDRFPTIPFPSHVAISPGLVTRLVLYRAKLARLVLLYINIKLLTSTPRKGRQASLHSGTIRYGMVQYHAVHHTVMFDSGIVMVLLWEDKRGLAGGRERSPLPILRPCTILADHFGPIHMTLTNQIKFCRRYQSCKRQITGDLP